MYEPGTYWEGLLSDHSGLVGVADPTHAEFALRESYRVVHRNVLRMLRPEGVSALDGTRVLDVGSGSGFWLDTWQQLGAQRPTALELTEVASERLRQSRADVDVVTGDITRPDLELPGSPYGFISAMSVLLHIVDDDAFHRALRNICRLLSDDGLFLLADPILVRRQSRHPSSPGDNSVARTFAEWQAALDAVGLRIARVQPSTVLQGNPIDVRSPQMLHALNRAWAAYGRLQSRARPRLARALVRTVSHTDAVLTRIPFPAVSAKLAVIRRKGLT